MGAWRNSTKQVKASLRMPLPGPPANSSCPASSPRLCIFQERASLFCGPKSVLAATLGTDAEAGWKTHNRMDSRQPHLGLRTWTPGPSSSRCFKERNCDPRLGEDINNNNINNSNGQVPCAMLSALRTLVRLASRAEVPVTLSPGPIPKW